MEKTESRLVKFTDDELLFLYEQVQCWKAHPIASSDREIDVARRLQVEFDMELNERGL